MAERRFVLSTVGISTLLRAADGAFRGQLIQAANRQELGKPLVQEVAELRERISAQLRADDVERNRQLSAELNGLYSLYHNQLVRGRQDMHELLATDTALGRLAAEIIREYLVSNGLTVSIYAPAQLSTANPSRFSRGIKTLIKWCEKTIPGYRRSGYRVIFNLTGGFKSLQGYLNIVGMFYADRLVYIFEGSQELLTVPRLPIRVAHEALHEHRVPLAMMAQGALIPRKRISAIPGGLLETDAGLATLSDWGLLIWTRARDELLGDELLDFPRLAYSARFRKAFDRATPSQRVALQETLAEVAGLLEDSEGDVTPLCQDSGLQYENYSSVRTHDGRPIAHFRLTRGRRVSCTPEPGGILLRTFGEHDIVNGKP